MVTEPRIMALRNAEHLGLSLKAAAALAIAHSNLPGDIIVSEWAKTYRCSEDDVREALKIAANGSRKLPEEVAVTAPKPIKQEEVEE